MILKQMSHMYQSDTEARSQNQQNHIRRKQRDITMMTSLKAGPLMARMAGP